MPANKILFYMISKCKKQISPLHQMENRVKTLETSKNKSLKEHEGTLENPISRFIFKKKLCSLYMTGKVANSG